MTTTNHEDLGVLCHFIRDEHHLRIYSAGTQQEARGRVADLTAV